MREYTLGTDQVLRTVTVKEKKSSTRLASHLGGRQNSQIARNNCAIDYKRVIRSTLIEWEIECSGGKLGKYLRFRRRSSTLTVCDFDIGGGAGVLSKKYTYPP